MSGLRSIAAALAFAAAATGLRAAILERPAPPALRSLSIPFPPRQARLFALSFAPAAADILWIRFVQDVPLRPADEVVGVQLANELQTVVALDPSFHAGYLQGTTLLSVLGNRPCESLDLLRDGMEHFPLDWRLPIQAGYECFSDLGDASCAARYMKRAAPLPGAPGWLPGLLARLLSQNQQAGLAVQMLEAELAHTTDPRLQHEFTERLHEARLTVWLDRLEEAVRRYRLAHGGEVPASLDVLVAEHLVEGIPDVDPEGGRFVLTPDGRVSSTSGKGRLRAEFAAGGIDPDDVRARLIRERDTVRATELLGHPLWLFVSTDELLARAGVLDSAVGTMRTEEWIEGSRERQNLYIDVAQVVIRHDLEALERERLEIVRRNPTARPDLVALLAAARVPLNDPFGTTYRLDADGRPAAEKGRNPAVNLRRGGSSACR